jgi:hypothetical protein
MAEPHRADDFQHQTEARLGARGRVKVCAPDTPLGPSLGRSRKGAEIDVVSPEAHA